MNKKYNIIFYIFLVLLCFISVWYYFAIEDVKKNDFKCGEAIFDYNNIKYNTIKIGEKCWMLDNLKSFTNVNGGKIKQSCYDNSSENCSLYGALYDYRTAFGGYVNAPITGICPSGWVVPSKADFNDSLNYIMETSLCVKDNNKNEYRCESGNYLSDVGETFLASVFSGTCDIVCDYEECVYNCSGAGCRNSFIYYEENDVGLIVGGRFYFDNCAEFGASIGFLNGGFDSLLNLRCVKY